MTMPPILHGPDDRGFVLDRQALEQDGHDASRSRGWWDSDDYLRLEDAIDPCRLRRDGSPVDDLSDEVRESLAILGLTWPCTEDEFRSACRLRSKETHPDSGGSADLFVVVNAAYATIKSGMRHWPNTAEVV